MLMRRRWLLLVVPARLWSPLGVGPPARLLLMEDRNILIALRPDKGDCREAKQVRACHSAASLAYSPGHSPPGHAWRACPVVATVPTWRMLWATTGESDAAGSDGWPVITAIVPRFHFDNLVQAFITCFQVCFALEISCY